jgi:hypothetical protein
MKISARPNVWGLTLFWLGSDEYPAGPLISLIFYVCSAICMRSTSLLSLLSVLYKMSQSPLIIARKALPFLSHTLLGDL